MGNSRRYRLKLATWMVVREPGQRGGIILNCPETAALLAREIVNAADDDKEHFWVILVNGAHRYLMHTLVATGTQQSSMVEPREVFGPALREGAAGIIVVHNHPDGEVEPSPADRETTRRLKECARILGIHFLDHLIVGNGTGQWLSFQKRGEL